MVSLASIVGPPSWCCRVQPAVKSSVTSNLRPSFTQPERPLVVVLGSRDTLDRIRNLYSLVLRADAVLVGGQMSQPFLAAIGHQPHRRGRAPSSSKNVGTPTASATPSTISIHLPSDLVWESDSGNTVTAGQLEVVDGSIGDIGPKTGIEYADVLRGAGTILWMGSLGKVEDDRFVGGTLVVGRALVGEYGQDRARRRRSVRSASEDTASCPTPAEFRERHRQCGGLAQRWRLAGSDRLAAGPQTSRGNLVMTPTRMTTQEPRRSLRADQTMDRIRSSEAGFLEGCWIVGMRSMHPLAVSPWLCAPKP